jgi:hypothetical protein
LLRMVCNVDSVLRMKPLSLTLSRKREKGQT